MRKFVMGICIPEFYGLPERMRTTMKSLKANKSEVGVSVTLKAYRNMFASVAPEMDFQESAT